MSGEVIVVFSGDGTPKLLMPTGNTVNNPAYDEAYDVLKRGVLGHFQPIPVPATAVEAAMNVLNVVLP